MRGSKLNKHEQRRAEAFALAASMNAGRYRTVEEHFRDAEMIERWIAEAVPGAKDDLPEMRGDDRFEDLEHHA